MNVRSIKATVLLLWLALGRSAGLLAEDPVSDRLEEALGWKSLRGEAVGLEKTLRTLERIAGEDPSTAVALCAELEALDLRLRLEKTDTVEKRIARLSRWSQVPTIDTRTRCLKKVLYVQRAMLIEPNAIAWVDIGVDFRERFLSSDNGSSGPRTREIPLEFPIRFLSGFSESFYSKKKHAQPPVVVMGFVAFEELIAADSAFLSKVLRVFELAPERVLVALFVYYENQETSPEVSIYKQPWRHLALFWVRGSFERLNGLRVRTRYEWLPGGTLFHVGFGGKVKSWSFPWQPEEGFVRDIKKALEE